MPPQTWHVDKRPLAHYVLIAALLFLLLSVRAASAHGGQGTVVVDNAPVGPYRLTAWVSPEVVRTGSVHFAVLVVVDGTPMSDCDVFIQVIPLDHNGPILSARMRPAIVSHHLQHEVELNLATEGHYEGRITVRDRADNGGWATFAIVVRPSSAWMVVLIYSQLVIAPFIGFWLLKEAIGAWLPQVRSHNNGKHR